MSLYILYCVMIVLKTTIHKQFALHFYFERFIYIISYCHPQYATIYIVQSNKTFCFILNKLRCKHDIFFLTKTQLTYFICCLINFNKHQNVSNSLIQKNVSTKPNSCYRQISKLTFHESMNTITLNCTLCFILYIFCICYCYNKQ